MSKQVFREALQGYVPENDDEDEAIADELPGQRSRLDARARHGEGHEPTRPRPPAGAGGRARDDARHRSRSPTAPRPSSTTATS